MGSLECDVPFCTPSARASMTKIISYFVMPVYVIRSFIESKLTVNFQNRKRERWSCHLFDVHLVFSAKQTSLDTQLIMYSHKPTLVIAHPMLDMLSLIFSSGRSDVHNAGLILDCWRGSPVPRPPLFFPSARFFTGITNSSRVLNMALAW